MTYDLDEKRTKFYQELKAILNRIATDEDRVAWIGEKLDPLLEDCFWQGFDNGHEQGYEKGCRDCAEANNESTM